MKNLKTVLTTLVVFTITSVQAQDIPVISATAEWDWLHPQDGVDPALADTNFNTTWYRYTDYDGPPFTLNAGPFEYPAGGVNVIAAYATANGITSTDIGQPPSGLRYSAYFKTRFTAAAPLNNPFVRICADDGCIIYVDGSIVARISTDLITTDQYLAFADIVGNEDLISTIQLNTSGLPGGVIGTGEHIVAVSLHNANTTSSDLGFFFEMLSAPPPPILPADLPGVTAGTNGNWNVRMYRDGGLPTCSVQGAVDVIAANLGTTIDLTVPVLNFYNPGSGLCDVGNLYYPVKNPFPGDTGAGEDNFVMLAKTTLSVAAAGDYTFGVNSDDGIALRVQGGRFTGRSGVALIDPVQAQTWFFSAGTCNVNSRGIYHFDAPGQYLVELVWFECGGNADVELFWAKGAFANVADTNTWQLVGNMAAAIIPPLLPPGPLPGPNGGEDFFGIRVIRGPTQTSIVSALAAVTDANATFVDTTSPVINFNDNDGTVGVAGLFGGDLDLPDNQAGEDDNYVVVAKGRIRITDPGAYTFGVHSDDGFALRIRGQNWLSEAGGGRIDPGSPETLFFAGTTGDSNSRATVNLAAGEYELEFIWFEGASGSSCELYAAKGAFACDFESRAWRLVGGKAVSPPATQQYIGVSAAGWTVEFSPRGGTALNTIADAEADLVGAPTVNNVPVLYYIDPQSRGLGVDCAPLFPSNTPADDDDFAIRATAQLVIPANGTYQLGFRGDDGAYIQVVGQTWDSIVSSTGAAVINGDRIDLNLNTGDSLTTGELTLNAGTYTIRTLMWERGGGAFHSVFGNVKDGPVDFLKAGGTAVATDSDGLKLAPPPGPTAAPIEIVAFTVNKTTGEFDLSWRSTPGTNYVVQFSNDLKTGSWNQVATATGAAGSTTNYHGTGLPLPLTNRSFRVRRP